MSANDYNPAHPPIRACFHCVHSGIASGADDRKCRAFDVVGIKREGVPCREARAINGPCGPEARFLKLRG